MKRSGLCKDLGELLCPPGRPFVNTHKHASPGSSFEKQAKGTLNLKNLFWCFKMVTLKVINPVITIVINSITITARAGSENEGTEKALSHTRVDLGRGREINRLSIFLQTSSK